MDPPDLKEASMFHVLHLIDGVFVSKIISGCGCSLNRFGFTKSKKGAHSQVMLAV